MARRCLLFVLSAGLVVLVWAGAAIAATATTPGTVAVAKVPGAGAVLVDGASGRTLYTLTDASGAAVPCTGACLSAWPALSVGAGAQATAPKGVKAVRATTDGGVTYRGRPLYLFSGDPQAGTANGNAIASFGGNWKVVRITGQAAKAAKPATAFAAAGSTTATTNPVQGYGY
jgi:predicted lipoprotein with Yx(FWY)xxD motif